MKYFSIPFLLVYTRLLLAPVMIVVSLQWGHPARFVLVGFIVLGLLTDVFDGIIARRMGISSPFLRRLDSQVDLIFWVSIAISACIFDPNVFYDHRWACGAVVMTEVLCYLISIIRFKRETCTHAFLSKLWGLCLLFFFIASIGFGQGERYLHFTVVWGLISQTDVMLIILLLPKWQNDIPSSYHAWLIRRGIPIKRNKWLNG
ncbi:MAG TPA: CDP-alcohol phosphatidyltransferase family protein [Luteibaculaceae bacterium]|nr:CDP-alcohol phosphatidyltransferase family protein [Luteibaculaceae bacterium]